MNQRLIRISIGISQYSWHFQVFESLNIYLVIELKQIKDFLKYFFSFFLFISKLHCISIWFYFNSHVEKLFIILFEDVIKSEREQKCKYFYLMLWFHEVESNLSNIVHREILLKREKSLHGWDIMDKVYKYIRQTGLKKSYKH